MTGAPAQPLDTDAAPAPGLPSPPAAAPGVRPRVPSLRRNFLFTLSGNVTYAACQWGILVVLAKLTSPEAVGQFVLGVAVASPIFLLANLQLGAVQATDAKRQTTFATYLRLRLLTTAAASAVVVGVVAASGYSAPAVAVVLLVGAAKALDSLNDIFHSFYQQNERMRHVATSLMTNGLASLAGVAAAVAWTRSVVWGAAAYAVGSAVALLGYNLFCGSALWRATPAARPGGSADASLWRSVSRRPWGVPELARLAWLALPVGASAALVALNANLPRYFIHHNLGDAALGIFAAIAYIVTAGVTFVGALGSAALPRLAQLYAAENYAAFARVLGKILLAAGAVGVAGIGAAVLAGRPLLTLLYRPEYAEHRTLFVWLMAAGAVTYVASVLGFAVTATRAFRMLTLPYAAVTAVTLLACALLVPAHGLRGAAGAVAVSGAAACASALWILYRLRRKERSRSEKGPESR